MTDKPKFYVHKYIDRVAKLTRQRQHRWKRENLEWWPPNLPLSPWPNSVMREYYHMVVEAVYASHKKGQPIEETLPKYRKKLREIRMRAYPGLYRDYANIPLDDHDKRMITFVLQSVNQVRKEMKDGKF